jgi:putative hydrolase of the HAD superfamily
MASLHLKNGMGSGRRHLIVDADDTLWENNIYFERAFDRFCAFLAHSHLTPIQVRAVLDEIEIANSKVHGYGSANFTRNLAQCFHQLAERQVSEQDIAAILALADDIVQQPIELLPGVQETLAYLSSRHDLTLFTKGNPEEQKLKLDRSGLAVFFGHTAIVKEKNAQSYSLLVEQRKLEKTQTWMIGNSPKSDINPALEVGLNAVFIPHPHTWRLEHEQVQQSPKLILIERFSQLQDYF